MGKRKPEAQRHHQQSQHHQLPKQHGKRRPTHLHRHHRKRRTPQNIHNKIHTNGLQKTHRRKSHPQTTPTIPRSNKKVNTLNVFPYSLVFII